ncbi:T cell receptor gamma variable 3, partial [Galemys pyrenaicus]
WSTPFQGQQEAMLWALVLLPIFLTPASQISFNSKVGTLSVTKQNGSIAQITCDIVDRTINYIHWYRYQEGKAPHHLLYFGFTGSKGTLGNLAVGEAPSSASLPSLPGCQAAVTLEQPSVVLGHAGGSAVLRCMAHTMVSYIHWYRHQEGKALERLLLQATFKSDVRWDSVLKEDKVTVMQSSDGSSCTLSVLRLQKGDEGTYYCAAWDTHSPAPCSGSCTKNSGFPNSCRSGNFHTVAPVGCPGVIQPHLGLSALLQAP